MLKFIYKLRNLDRLEKELKEKIRATKEEHDRLADARANLTDEVVIEKILGRQLKWFDYQKLPKDAQLAYYQEAQQVLRTDVFQNELVAYTLDLVEEIAKRSKDFDHVLSLRSKIAMGEIFRQRLMDIQDPNAKPKPSTKDLYSAI